MGKRKKHGDALKFPVRRTREKQINQDRKLSGRTPKNDLARDPRFNDLDLG